MAIFKVTAPKSIDVKINLPASKSISNRALIISALAEANFNPENLSDCDDTQVMIKGLESDASTVNVLAAGTAMRFLTSYFSIAKGSRIITGTKRLCERPISELVDSLRLLGADIEYLEKEGYPPLAIQGKNLQTNAITLKSNISSQYISALLMIAPMLESGLGVHLDGEVVSKPYINLTIEIMKEYGANVKWINNSTIKVLPQKYRSTPFLVENDWSAASYWYQIVALSENATITLPGLFKESLQGDSNEKSIFSQIGVKTEFVGNDVILSKEAPKVNYLSCNLVDMPDIAQTLVVTCALLGISFCFSGLSNLKIKETDRIAALIKEMRKLGYVIREKEEGTLSWDKEMTNKEEKIIIETYKDHRMAMAFAPASLKVPSIEINDPMVVTKSYPHYWEDLNRCGFKIEDLK